MKNYKIIVCFIIILTILDIYLYAQNPRKIDSLKKILLTEKIDSNKIIILNKIASAYYTSHADSTILFAQKAAEIGEKAGLKKSTADAEYYIGIGYYAHSNYDKAMEYYQKSLSKYEAQKDKINCAYLYNSIGIIYQEKGKYQKAIEYYFKTLKINEGIGNKSGIAESYNCIGIIYDLQKKYEEALEYHLKSLKINEEIGDKDGISISYNEIGGIYRIQKRYDKAIDYHLKALKLSEEVGNTQIVIASLGNLGSDFSENGKYDKAIEYYLKCLKILETTGDKSALAILYANLGNIYFKKKKINEAINYENKAIILAKEIDTKNTIQGALKILTEIYSSIGNYKLAYEAHQKFSDIKDSLLNKENSKLITEMQAKYETEKKQLQIEKLEKQKALDNQTIAMKNTENKKQQMFMLLLLAIAIAVVVIAIIIFRSLRTTRQQKKMIETQKDEIETQRDLVTLQKERIEEIHKEVTDSIQYAQKIQTAVLPNIDQLLRSNQYSDHRILITDYFILFKPKDIVSGDFYYLAQRKNILLIAVADCTGHGVPGAFMSMLGISFLNEIIVKEEVQSASHVLEKLRQYVIQSLQQKGIFGEQKDGMDIAFCVINTVTLEMQFAGANNPCYIVTSHQSAVGYQQPFSGLQTVDCGLIELKGDKQPIGIHINMQPFTNQMYQFQKGDIIYLMSDGFEDQFGGPNRKKFLAKNLKNLLMANCQLPMANQKQTLESTITEWIGTGEQIDDITIFGIKI